MEMVNSNKKIFFILPFIFSIALLSGCGAGTKMISTWQDKEIKIDGISSEWSTGMQQIPDKRVNIGIRNDAKFLYLCLTSEDRARIMMLARAGFIIWFEPESGDKNRFGIRYPMPSKQPEAPKLSEMNREEMNLEGPDKNLKKIVEQQNEFQILNNDKFPLTALPIMNSEGIEAKLGFQSNQFVYELKVPLASSKQFSYIIDALPGGNVKIRFETEEFDAMGMREANSGIPSNDGEVRPGVSPGRRGGGMREGMGGGRMLEPLNYSLEIKLESAPGAK